MNSKVKKMIVSLVATVPVILGLIIVFSLVINSKSVACYVVNSLIEDDVQLERIESAMNIALADQLENLTMVGWFDRLSLHPIYEYPNRQNFFIDSFAHRFEITHLTSVVSDGEGRSPILRKAGIWLNGSLIQFSVEANEDGSKFVQPKSREIQCNMSDEAFGKML